MARYADPERLPFTLVDDDAGDRLSVALVFDIPGVSIAMTGDRTGQLTIDPIQKEDSFPILLEVTDGKEKTKLALQLTLGDASPDDHQIVMAITI